MTISKEILSYIAGYTDGDGCFSIRKQTLETRSKYAAQFIITSTDISVMKFLKENLGGSYIIGDKRERFPNDKIQYRFCICGKLSGEMAKLILPFLIERKKQCLCYIQFIETNCKKTKDRLIKKMKILKHSTNFVSKEDLIFLNLLRIPKE